MGEVACKNNEKPKSPSSRVASDIIDDTEFLALEKLLLLFGQKSRKESQESDAKQLNDCFDNDSRYKNLAVINLYFNIKELYYNVSFSVSLVTELFNGFKVHGCIPRRELRQ